MPVTAERETLRPRAHAPELHLRVGTRLSIALAVPIASLIAAFAVFEDHANRVRSREEVSREGRTIARTVQLAAGNALRDRQLSDVKSLIDDISNHESILGVRLFDADGRLEYAPANLSRAPVLPAEEVRRRIRTGRVVQERFRVEGRPVIAWLAPLTRPPGPPLGASEILQLESFVEEDAAASSRAIAVLAAMLIVAITLTVLGSPGSP